jgi:hypothetical protein
MPSTYIHIDSSFRNRNDWEFPSEFNVCVNYTSVHNDSQISLSSGYIEYDGSCNVSFYNGTLPPSISNISKLKIFKNTQNWVNPTSNSAPIHTIRIQSLADPFPLLPITFGGGTNIIPILSILNTISKDNVYNGYYIIKNPNSIVDCEIRVIQSYNSAVRTVNLNQPFDLFNGTLDEYVLIDPSVAKNIITNSFPAVSFPFTNISSGTLQDYINTLPYDNKNICHLQFTNIFNGQTAFLDNFYNNFHIYNVTNNQYSKIISFDGSLKLAFLDKYIEFNYNDVIILCKNLPLYVSQSSTIFIDQNLITFDNVTLKDINTTNPAYAYIIPSLPTNYPPFVSETPPPGLYNPPVSTPPGYFFGPLGCDPILNDKSPKIKDCIFKVNGYTSIDFCNKTVLDVCGPISSKYFSVPSPKYVILFLSDRDSFNSSVFSLNKFPTSEMACYRLQLLSLILPNTHLETGSRISFYPYVFVEFQNDGTSNSKVQFQIASNNPNASSATFIAPIGDISNPIVTIFTKISSYGMAPTFRFSPEQNFKFKVYLPDGTLFKTVLKDNKPPLPPNPLVQISAVFDVTRI